MCAKILHLKVVLIREIPTKILQKSTKTAVKYELIMNARFLVGKSELVCYNTVPQIQQPHHSQ